jgi:3-phosphoshikimate 1-carboxyvinyltransferase
MVAALAQGSSVLKGALFSDDSKWMLQCLRILGIDVASDKAAGTLTVHGKGAPPSLEAQSPLFVGNAGTAARFLPCLVAAGTGSATFEGDPRMSERPLGPLLRVLESQGADIRRRRGDAIPFSMQANGLRGGDIRIDLTDSTQFASGLLMAAPFAGTDLTVIAEGDRTQLPYVDMTAAVMEQFGVLVKAEAGRYTVAAGQRYKAQPAYQVEPDLSGAAYFFAAIAAVGGKVKVAGVSNASIQGDIRFLKVLQHMGVRFYQEEDGSGLTAERLPQDALKGGVTVDMNAFSDQALTLAAIAPFASAPVKIVNVAHIRKQECDRIHAIVHNLTAMGIQVEEREDGVTVHPGTPKGAAIKTFGDHRVAMAFSLVGLKVPGVVIDDPACTAKTFADYWQVLERFQKGDGHGA